MQLFATPYWTGFILAIALVSVGLIAYSARNRLMWLLRNWPWLLLGLAALAGIVELALNYADVLDWLARQFPQKGAAGLPPTDSYALPEWATGLPTERAFAWILLILSEAGIIIFALFGKIQWKRATVLALALALIAFVAAYPAGIIAMAQDIPHQAARLWGWAFPVMTLALLWTALVFVALGTSIALLRSDVSGVEKLVAFGAIALVVTILSQVLSNSDGTWATFSGGPTLQEPRLALAPASSPCDSYEVPYTYEAAKPAVPFNKEGRCGPALWYEGHCIWVQGFRSDVPVRLCDKPGEPRGEFPLGVEYAWSADGYAFQAKYRLDPPRYTTLLNITPRRW